MKRIAILSAGPSLCETWRGGEYDSIIGVNRAATMFVCDWWSAGDFVSIEKLIPMGAPMLFTMCKTADQLTQECKRWEELMHVSPLPRVNYSTNAALKLAYWLGAKCIDVYGHDMANGEAYCNGEKARKRIGDLRWRKETAEWNVLIEWLKGEGVKVDRKLSKWTQNYEPYKLESRRFLQPSALCRGGHLSTPRRKLKVRSCRYRPQHSIDDGFNGQPARG